MVTDIKCEQLALGFFGFFQKLAEMMEHIEDHLSYLCRYAEPMFQKSVSVQEVCLSYCGRLCSPCCGGSRVGSREEVADCGIPTYICSLRMWWASFASFADFTSVIFQC